MKHGQLTLYIIIGLLVLIAFSITLYVGSTITPKITPTPPPTNSINDYITTCLTLTAAEGLNLLGKQGGRLYPEQNGTSQANTTITYQDDVHTYRIAPLITPPQGTIGQDNCAQAHTCLFYSQPPHYPFEQFPYQDHALTFNGYYGTSTLPPLHAPNPRSIQHTLEQYIAGHIRECADFTPFTDNGYTISADNPTATLLISPAPQRDAYTTAQLSWHVTATNPHGDTTTYTDYTAKIPVRLTTIYATASTIIDHDITNITYQPHAPPPFTVTTTPHQDNSIIILTDNNSILNGDPYQFWIYRQNRRPALWHIPSALPTFHITPEGRGATITINGNKLIILDPCQEPGTSNPTIIELNATDPDEDAAVFEASTNELPRKALTTDYHLTITAKDGSTNTQGWFDYQELPLTAALCEIR